MDQVNITALKRILEESTYTVALCGSGMMEEGGFEEVKSAKRAYEIERQYGVSPEYLFTSTYYNTRPAQFFEFYKNEMLNVSPEMTDSSSALAALEAQGKLQCVITGNIYRMAARAGCKNVINLHGSVYDNRCSRCQKSYSMEFVRDSKGIPTCDVCGAVIRPKVSLFGEMIDSQLMTHTTEEIEKADTLLLLGTTLKSEVFSNYIRYFGGRNIVIIHAKRHYLDHEADLIIIEQPKVVLPLLIND